MSYRTRSLVNRAFPMPTRDPCRTMIPTPSRTSRPPRVTMNEGIRSRATSVPCIAPTPALTTRAATMATHQGHPSPLGCTRSAATTADNAMTRPTERSISPRSRGKISAMASTMYTALCSMRLTRFRGDRNFESRIWKATATTTMARTTGSTPLSPLRTRSHHARRYCPRESAISSGGISASAT